MPTASDAILSRSVISAAWKNAALVRYCTSRCGWNSITADITSDQNAELAAGRFHFLISAA